MRQVPKYGIIGHGRMAIHFSHYLELLDIPYLKWARSENSKQSLYSLIRECNPILLLISDSAIEPFIKDNSKLLNKTLVHFSGSLVSSFCSSAHPLMTFGSNLYHEQFYKELPFIIEEEGPSFNKLLPGLKNPNYKIPKKQKPYYHSLCVMSGNFSCILWQKFYKELQDTFNLPKEIINPYLMQTCKNIIESPENALTGPIKRLDFKTIESNLQALELDKFKEIYKTFVKTFTKFDVGV